MYAPHAEEKVPSLLGQCPLLITLFNNDTLGIELCWVSVKYLNLASNSHTGAAVLLCFVSLLMTLASPG